MGEWNPKAGAQALVSLVGKKAMPILHQLLSGDVQGASLLEAPYQEVLVHIGNGHAMRLMMDGSGGRLVYWPRAWAARAIGYVGSEESADVLVTALNDEHWRVRMNALVAMTRLGIADDGGAVEASLADEHERVRSAAATALGRFGDLEAVDPLLSALDDESDEVFRRVDQALKRLERLSQG